MPTSAWRLITSVGSGALNNMSTRTGVKMRSGQRSTQANGAMSIQSFQRADFIGPLSVVYEVFMPEGSGTSKSKTPKSKAIVALDPCLSQLSITFPERWRCGTEPEMLTALAVFSQLYLPELMRWVSARSTTLNSLPSR